MIKSFQKIGILQMLFLYQFKNDVCYERIYFSQANTLENRKRLSYSLRMKSLPYTKIKSNFI